MRNHSLFEDNIIIDIDYDVRNDSNGGDPDKCSKILKNYHKKLRSKKLPNGQNFDLSDDIKNTYLYHKSELGEYFLSSDSITHSYWKWKKMKNIIEVIPNEEIMRFLNLSYTIGGFILFPANRVDNKSTINQERWFNQKICDRFDLTLECIRLYYLDQDSPLLSTLKRYDNYFKLFEDFKWYCKYFLLQDLVSSDYTEIKFYLPFNGFKSKPVPESTDEYYEYKKNNIEFLIRRNERIQNYYN